MYSLPNFSFNSLLDSGSYLKNQLIAYLVNKTLGKFLILNKSGKDNQPFQFQLFKGSCQLKDIGIQTEAINELILDLPFRVIKGNIDLVEIIVPWHSMLTEPCHIKISGVDLIISLMDEVPINKEKDSGPIGLSSSSVFIANEFLAEIQDATKPADPSHTDNADVDLELPDELGSLPEDEGVSMISGWIDSILTNLKISFEDIQFRATPKDSKQELSNLKLSFSSFSSHDAIDPDFKAEKGFKAYARSFIFRGMTLGIEEKGIEHIIVTMPGANDSVVEIKVDQPLSEIVLNYLINVEIQARFTPILARISPTQLEWLIKFAKPFLAQFKPTEFSPNTTPKASEFGVEQPQPDLFSKYRVHANLGIDILECQILYEPTDLSIGLNMDQQSYIDLEMVKAKLELASQPKPNQFPEGFGPGRLHLEAQVQTFTLTERLSTFQYPTKLVGESNYSWKRDHPLPILSMSKDLPDPESMSRHLSWIEELGLPVPLKQENSSGLMSMWGKKGSSANSINSGIEDMLELDKPDLTLTLESRFGESKILKVHSLPVTLRIDARMADRFHHYAKVLIPVSEDHTDSLFNENILSQPGLSDMPSQIYGQNQIIDDLDQRNSLGNVSEIPFQFELDTEAVRIYIFTPGDSLGDDITSNHRMARVHPDFWVMDVNRPRLFSPKASSLTGLNEMNIEKGPFRIKIDYQELDISLYLLKENLCHCFLNIAMDPELDHLTLPSLDITMFDQTKPGSNGHISPQLLHRLAGSQLFSGSGPLPVPFPEKYKSLQEGEVKVSDQVEQMDDDILMFKQRTIETSQIAIHCYFPKLVIKFDAELYERNQFIVNDISAFEPTLLTQPKNISDKDSSDTSGRSSPALSFHTAMDYKSTFPPTRASEYPTSNLKGQLSPITYPGSLLSLVVHMPNLSIELDADSSVYQLHFSECRFFSTTKLFNKPMSYAHIESEELFLSDLTNPISAPILTPSFNGQPKSSFCLTTFSSMDDIPNPGPIIKDTLVNIALRGLDFMVTDLRHQKQVIGDLSEFFDGRYKIPTVSNTCIKAQVGVNLCDLTLGLAANEDSPMAMAVIERAGLSTTIFSPNPETLILGGVDSLLLLLSPHPPSTTRSPTSARPAVPISEFWARNGFATLAQLQYLKLEATMYQQPNPEPPRFKVRVLNPNLNITSCKDSLELIKKLMELAGVELNDLDADEDDRSNVSNEDDHDEELNEREDDSDSESQTKTLNSDKFGQLEQSISYNILEHLDDFAFQPSSHSTKPPHLPPRSQSYRQDSIELELVEDFFAINSEPRTVKLNRTRTSDLGSEDEEGWLRDFDTTLISPTNVYFNQREVMEDYYGYGNDKRVEVVKVLDFGPMTMVEDYFEHCKGDEIESDNEQDQMSVELRDLCIHIQLFPGEDFPTSPSPAPTLTRPFQPSMEISLNGISLDYQNNSTILDHVDQTRAARIRFGIKDLEIVDRITTSTWDKFVSKWTDCPQGESGKGAVEVELSKVNVSRGKGMEKVIVNEYLLKAHIQPLRFYIDQDALTFMVDFFIPSQLSYPIGSTVKKHETQPQPDMFFQYVELGGLDVKVDYKPKRLDVMGLSSGNWAELMNVFHLEEAVIGLEPIELNGVNGIEKLVDDIVKLWVPYITSTQLPGMARGVGPLRPLMSLGTGLTDLVVLPIKQYKRDGRIIKGMQRGATSFVKATTTEMLRATTSLALTAHTLLEQAENIIQGPNQNGEEETKRVVSKYAGQPKSLGEGMEMAYQSLARNLDQASRTIFALPVEVVESAGSSQTRTRSIVKAIPIAMLHPMMGLTSALSLAMLGLRNSLDPTHPQRINQKYKAKQ